MIISVVPIKPRALESPEGGTQSADSLQAIHRGNSEDLRGRLLESSFEAYYNTDECVHANYDRGVNDFRRKMSKRWEQRELSFRAGGGPFRHVRLVFTAACETCFWIFMFCGNTAPASTLPEMRTRQTSHN